MNVPETEGVPLMVIILLAQATDTPVGRPVVAPIPAAPVVLCVILVRAVLIHRVGVDEGVPTEFKGLTVIAPVVLILPHPPVSGIL